MKVWEKLGKLVSCVSAIVVFMCDQADCHVTLFPKMNCLINNSPMFMVMPKRKDEQRKIELQIIQTATQY